MILIHYNAISSLKDIKKNFDLSNLVWWLGANKIALNANKTDLKIFWSPRKQITKKMNFCLHGQIFRQKTCTKYLGVLLDKHLLFKNHTNTLKQKLNKASGILAKLRHHLPSDILNAVHCSFWYKSRLNMSGLGTRQPWHTSHGSKSSKQSPKNNKFQERKTPKWTSIHWCKDT